MKGAIKTLFSLATLVAVVWFSVWHTSTRVQPETQLSPWEGYAAAHEHTPMIAMPGMSPANLATAVTALKKSATAAVLPFSDDLSGTLHAYPYPFAFLSQLGITEEARRALADEPSKATGEAYHQALSNLFDVYEKDIQAMLQLLSASRPLQITSFGGYASTTHIRSVLGGGLTRLHLMKEEEERRYACAQGDAAACVESTHWPETTSTRTVTRPIPLDRFIPTEVASNRDALRTYASVHGVEQHNVRTIALSSSHCYPSYEPTYFDVGMHASQLSGVPAVFVTLLSDAFFYNLSNINVRFSEALMGTGAVYSYQPFNVYICQDSGYELGDLLTIRYTQEELATHPLSLKKPFAFPFLHNLIAAQNAFVDAPITTQAAYHRFIAQANFALSVVSDHELAVAFGSPEAPKRLRNYALGARTRSAQFEHIVGYFDDLQASAYTTAYFDPYRTNVFAILRSGLSPLLLTANESGPFPVGTSLFYKASDTELPPTGFSLLSYERDLKDRHTLIDLLLTHDHAHKAVMEPLIIELRQRREGRTN